MRVAYLIDSFNLGGAERMTATLLERLVEIEPDIDPTLVILSPRADDTLLARVHAIGVPVERLAVVRLASPAGWRQVHRFLRRNRPDVVHLQLEAANVLGAPLARLRGCGVVTTIHTFDTRGRDRSSLRSRLYHFVVRHLADRVVVVSAASREHLIGTQHYGSARLVQVHNGVDTRRFAVATGDRRHAARAALGIGRWDSVIMAMCVLRQPKGIQHLLAAGQQVRREVPNLRIVIGGDGPFAEALRQQCSEQGLDDVVHFLGARDDVEDLLPAADVFVHPTLADVLPTGVIEAMSCGLAVVASDTGGLPDMISHGTTGLLVAPGDEPALADALVGLLNDPARRAALGVAARSRVEAEFDLDLQVRRLADIYRQSVKPRHRSRFTRRGR